MMSTGARTSCSRSASSRPEPVPVDGLGVGEVGYLITGVKDVRQSRVGDTVTNAGKPRHRRRSAATRTRSRWCSPASTRSTAPTTRSCATPSTSCSSTTPRWSTSRRPRRRSASASGAASSACCTWRSCASGSSASSTSTSSRPRPTSSTASCMEDGTERIVTNPSEFPDGKIAEVLRAGRARHDPRAERVRRRDHGALPDPARHAARHGLPVRGPRRAALHAAARRDRLRLLRPAEVADPRLRLARLRADRRAGRRPGQGRHPAAGRDGRRVQRDRAQGQGLRVRRADDRRSCAS